MASKESDELELSGTTKGLGLGLLIASIVLIARGAGGRNNSYSGVSAVCAWSLLVQKP